MPRQPMNIAHSMCFVIQRAGSLAEILDSAVDLIAREMGTDVCSIYLLDSRDHRLRLMATKGLDKGALGKVTLALGEGLTGTVVKEMRSLAVVDASSHPGYRYFPETREEQFQSFLGVPLAIQRRPVGAIVVQTRDRRSYSPDEIQALSTISSQLAGVVENARLIDALDRGEEGNRYLREVRSWRSLGRVVPDDRNEEMVLSGTPASPGIAIGTVLFRGSYDLAGDLDAVPHQGMEAELQRVSEAFEKTRKEILRIQEAAQREAGEEHAMIFSSHLLLLNDPLLHDRIEIGVRHGETAARAMYGALEHFCQKLENVPDPYIQDRMEDIRDLRSRLLGQIVASRSQSPTVSEKIVVTRGIPPSLVVELKAEGARGFVAERGGPTSHGILLARSMGIPAVTGIVDVVLLVRSGDTIIIDGSTGKVIASPSEKSIETHEKLAHAERTRKLANQKYRDAVACTRDGVRVCIQANIGVSADLLRALENGAEGVGLYRTEFPFILREEIPTEEEQVRIYCKAYDAFPAGPINFRLLDLGGDKFLARGAIEADRNPFRGYRSLRVLLENPDVLRGQVQAFAKAAGQRPLSILIPMISSLPELRTAMRHIREAILELPGNDVNRAPRIGAMIEVPAAVELADKLAREVDYFSIGSNDLTQYALAVDRENPRAGDRSDTYHPAVLRLIRRAIEAGHAGGKPVSLCGEVASNWRLAMLFVCMGIDSLSVNPDVIPELKRAFAAADAGPLRAGLDELLDLGDAAEIEERLNSLLPGSNGVAGT